ncbi:aminopeptidase [Actinidia rufa]|uniref:Aminopeptidase n=1 Tax=Actinidia rufa TaxID=165716 RepID=A0A7J0DFZ0_9ERIC|nr:aminopeptidase [Actinidia rufa]
MRLNNSAGLLVSDCSKFDPSHVVVVMEWLSRYIIFCCGIGIDRTADYFFMEKVDMLIARLWVRKSFGQKVKCTAQERSEKDDEISVETYQDDLYVEWIRLEKMKLSFHNLLGQITIQEPIFDRMIVVYRRANTNANTERGIFVKHFKNIPMADMEIVLVAMSFSASGTYIGFFHNLTVQVKEVISPFSILMEQGKATRQDIDLCAEELIKEEFGESCNFDVDDAVKKLQKLAIVDQDTIGRYYYVGLKRANEIIGTTTEELVLKPKQSTSVP